MIGQFQNFSHEDNKGLFTFYREQAEKQQEIQKLKKLRKIAKAKEEQARRIKEQQQNSHRDVKSKLSNHTQSKQVEKNANKSQRDPGLLYQPKNRRQKCKKQQLGTSVVIVNSRELTNEHRSELTQRSVDQKYNMKRIEDMINPQNNNRYFLQNKELPISFGKMSLQKQITKIDESENTDRQVKVRNVLKPSYFNSYNSTDNEPKYLASISYQKLPQLQRKPPNSQIILPRRYKSKKIETALKSNNSQLIRQIRQSLRQQSSALDKDKVSYIDVNNCGPMFNAYQKEYQQRLSARLDAKQKRLIDIIRNNSNINRRKV